MYKVSLRQLTIAVVFIILLASIGHVSFAQEDTATEPVPVVPAKGTILMHLNDQNITWLIDAETGNHTPYTFAIPTTRFQGYFIDFENQWLYGVEVPDSANWFQRQFGTFDFVKVDLKTGKQTALYRGENIALDGHYPNSEKFALISSLSQAKRTDKEATPDFCILNLKTSKCSKVNEYAAISFFQFGPVYWLDEKTFTDGNWVTNALTGEKKRILTDWRVWGFAPSMDANELLVIARTDDGQMPLNGGAGFYKLNLTTFELSKKVCDAPAFDKVFTLHLSSDGQLLQFVSRNGTTYQNTILDFTSCQTPFDAKNLGNLIWLPNSHNLLAQVNDDNGNPSAIVRIDADTGKVTKLFDLDETVNFTVIQ